MGLGSGEHDYSCLGAGFRYFDARCQQRSVASVRILKNAKLVFLIISFFTSG